MIPSRSRGDRLLGCLDSMYSKASNPDQIEALIKIDNDDIDSYVSAIADIKKITRGNCKVLISDRLDGYWSLDKAWNDLAKLSQGEFLYLLNDDVVMETQDWDVVVGEYSGKICVVQGQCSNDQGLWLDSVANIIGLGGGSSMDTAACQGFPLIHREIPETCGFLSPTPFNDTYIHDFAIMLGIEIRDDRLRVTHNRHGNDETYTKGAETSVEQGPIWQQWYARYTSEEIQDSMARAAKRFRERFPKTKT